MLEQFLPRTDFSSYEDFSRELPRSPFPQRFNFAWDVVDVDRRERAPGARALVWCDEKGDEATFTFGQMAELSTRAATFFLSLGIGRGDP